jgi:hypothetical protein
MKQKLIRNNHNLMNKVNKIPKKKIRVMKKGNKQNDNIRKNNIQQDK